LAARSAETPLLYIADENNNVVNIYLQSGNNQSPIGQITGLSTPASLAVAGNRDLFVYNSGNSTITAYHNGSTTPFETLTGSDGYGVAIDSHENVYAANFNGSPGTINVYSAGSTIPTSTLTDTNLALEFSMAVDESGAVFVAGYNSTYAHVEIDEFPAGSTNPKILAIPVRPAFAYIALEENDNLVVADNAIGTISVYARPYKTIFPVSRFSFAGSACGIALDTSESNIWTANNTVVNGNNVATGQEYTLATGTLLDSTSTTGLSNACGIAVSPRAKI
jgi:hypothetical protein